MHVCINMRFINTGCWYALGTRQLLHGRPHKGIPPQLFRKLALTNKLTSASVTVSDSGRWLAGPVRWSRGVSRMARRNCSHLDAFVWPCGPPCCAPACILIRLARSERLIVPARSWPADLCLNSHSYKNANNPLLCLSQQARGAAGH